MDDKLSTSITLYNLMKQEEDARSKEEQEGNGNPKLARSRSNLKRSNSENLQNDLQRNAKRFRKSDQPPVPYKERLRILLSSQKNLTT